MGKNEKLKMWFNKRLKTDLKVGINIKTLK